jgi:uncharacterized protein (DUF2141 family)
MNYPRYRHRLASLAAVAVIGACAAWQSQRAAACAGRGGAAASTTQPANAPLSVTIKDLRSRKGDLIFGVFDRADGFPNVQDKSIYWEVKPADARSV